MAFLLLFGCSKQQETGNPAESTAAATPPPPPPTIAAAPVTDANILAALDEGDSAEITLGKLALKNSKNPEVKGFANMMITDHSKMWKDKKDLAKKLKITPQLPANDQEPARLATEMSAFNAAPTPMAFDSIYIDDAVADHTQVLAIVKDFETKATAPELKDALAKAEPVVQKHLDHAKIIQKDLSKPRPMAAEKKAK
ncbi:MAG: DUF4142 domain-containing protein [Candidatus Kapaibacterium sp.]